jgi:hypothetical protein
LKLALKEIYIYIYIYIYSEARKEGLQAQKSE